MNNFFEQLKIRYMIDFYFLTLKNKEILIKKDFNYRNNTRMAFDMNIIKSSYFMNKSFYNFSFYY